MRWIALLVAAALSAAAGAKAGPDSSPDQIARLVAQLGSARFAEREAATRALDAIGDAALDALKTAATAADAETRRRASELLDRIGQRNMVARLLKPTSIALDFNNVPLEEAVKTLARSTGLPIELPAPARYSARRVTVKSGPLPVWEAIELFCRKADLHEWDGASPLQGQSANATAIATQQANMPFVQGQVIIGGRIARSSNPLECKVVLLDGPGPNAVAFHTGAVRLRVLPAGTAFPMSSMADDIVLPLQASAEPRLQWAGVLGVRVDKAIDDSGRSHDATGVVAPLNNFDEMTWVMVQNGAMMPQISGRVGPAALRINRGDKSAKKLREVTGEVTAQVHVTEALARTDGPLQSGTSASGAGGVQVKLGDVTTIKPGEIKLSVELSLPPDVQPAGQLPAAMNRVAFQGGMVIQQQIMVGPGMKPMAPPLAAGTTEFGGLSLEDAQGRRWSAVSGIQESMRLGPQGLTSQLTLTFKAPAPDSTPARLVFSGSRPAVIAIPFSFRDVPLP